MSGHSRPILPLPVTRIVETGNELRLGANAQARYTAYRKQKLPKLDERNLRQTHLLTAGCKKNGPL
ncbi:hypothetical protein JL39_11745 [Rhizobium sp. YS-1r]|nr:hypothetical protein JL39_11745 [Rhizobium sp. YS-1r]